MIIDCISDLHGHFPKLCGGDLLIVAGDYTARDTFSEYEEIFRRIGTSRYRKKIVIGGNHDNFLADFSCSPLLTKDVEYLFDTQTNFEGLKIWGSPWTLSFPEINPKCTAFTLDEEEQLEKKWERIPDDVDILITHSPPFGKFSTIKKGDKIVDVGSPSLAKRIEHLPNLKLHVFGHIHEHGGKTEHLKGSVFVNAAIVNELYKPINKVVKIGL